MSEPGANQFLIQVLVSVLEAYSKAVSVAALKA